VSWLSFSDDYTRQQIWDGLPYDTRWMYHCLVEHLAATRRYDGRTSWANAVRCSDVLDPKRCLDDLLKVSLVTGNEGAEIAVTDIESFLPPPHLRTENLLPRKRANQSTWRKARCAEGLHTKDCPAGTCPVKIAKKERVTGNEDGLVANLAGSGRVGLGREHPQLEERDLEDTIPAHLKIRAVS
jgi:hypothetical protein